MNRRNNRVALVRRAGGIRIDGSGADYAAGGGVRPALWLILEPWPPHTPVQPIQTARPLVEAAPPIAVSSRSSCEGWNARDVRVRETVLAIPHPDYIGLQFHKGWAITYTASRGAVYSVHQLDGRFTGLTGFIIPTYESINRWHNGRFRFYADGVLIGDIEYDAHNETWTLDILLDVTGVQQLRISFYNSSSYAANIFATYAFQGILW